MDGGQMILHQCEQCNKRFPNKQSLDRHEISHDLEEVASWVSSQSENENTSSEQIAVHIPPHKKLITEANGTEHAMSDDAQRMTSIQQEYMLQESKQPYVKSASVRSKSIEQGSDPMDDDNGIKDDKLGTNNDKQIKSNETPSKSLNGNKRPRMTATQTPREKVFACDECSRSYTRRDHLNRHKLSHTGERPFVCSVCLKSFIRKDKLQRHERIHNGEKVCSCNICGKFFSRKDMLVKHLKVHTEGSPQPLTKEKQVRKKVRQPDFIVKELAEKKAATTEQEDPPVSTIEVELPVSTVQEVPLISDSPVKLEPPAYSLKEEPNLCL